MNPLAVFALAGLIQGPDEVIAHYTLDGKPAVVTRADVAMEMAFHLRRMEEGRQACDVLVNSALTEREAERLGLMPKEVEIQQFWSKLQEQLRAAGRDPKSFAAVRNSTAVEWMHDLGLQLAQESLVRHALSLDKGEDVSGDMLRLWLSEQRKKVTIVTDPDLLPVGTAVRVAGRGIAIAELGLLMLRTSEDAERDRFTRQVVYLTTIEYMARKHGIDVHQMHLDAAIRKRRREAAGDPRYRGLSFEQLLETQGLSLAALLQSRVFRAKVMQDLLTDVLHPESTLRQELEKDHDAVVARVGARRRIGLIYRRALDQPNPLVPHDFDSAAKSLQGLRERLKIEKFDIVARIETDDPAGKQTGGDAGWHHRSSERLPASVVAAAFKGQKGAVIGPVHAADGCYLVRVADIEPDLDDGQLVDRLRQKHSDALAREILLDADIKWQDGRGAKGTKR